MRTPLWTVTRLVAAAAIALAARPAAGAEYPLTFLHSNTNGGRYPSSTLVSDGTWLYGAAVQAGGGTIFKFKPTDPLNTFDTIHHFVGGANDGWAPWGDLLLVGTTLYGTTEQGGSPNFGIVFSLQTNATTSTPLTILRHFLGGPADGSAPHGGLVEEGGVLYGTTAQGGTSRAGTIFKVKTDGTGYSSFHSFRVEDGTAPAATLVLIPGTPSSTLYGTTQYSSIFKVKTDGTDFHVIKGLSGGPSEGAFPAGLAYDGSKYIYGTTFQGGSADAGTIFRFNKDDDNDAQWLLHDFGPTPEPNDPTALLYANGVLYGATYLGGNPEGDNGTVFSLNADGSGFKILAEFAGPPDGSHPLGKLALFGTTLWGTTMSGGDLDYGTIFRVENAAQGQTPVVAHSFLSGELNDVSPSTLAMDAGGNLYGTTEYLGGDGVESVFKVKTDGTLRILHSFSKSGFDGRRPLGELVLVPGSTCGTLYGATSLGGTHDQGTIFSISTDDDGWGYAILHDFGAEPTDGIPTGPLTLNRGYLYGTSKGGGQYGMGSVFKLKEDARRGVDTLTHAYSFQGAAEGSNPAGNVVFDADGNIYGMTSRDDSDYSVEPKVFKIKSDGSIRTLASFAPAPSLQAIYSHGFLTLDAAGSFLYGATVNGGLNDLGTIFKVSTADATTTATVLHDFTASDAGNVRGVILGGVSGTPSLIGTAFNGGPNKLGSVFSLPVDATTATPLNFIHSFNYGADDVIGPQARPMLDAVGNLWGMSAYAGGAYGAGGTFKITGPFGAGRGGDGTGDGNCSGSCAPPSTPQPSNTGPYCQGSAISLSTAAVPGATYQWSGPNGFSSALRNPIIANAAPANAGDYVVTITVGGCASAPGKTTVVVNACGTTPTPTVRTLPAAGAGSPNRLAEVDPHSGATYAWTITNGTITSGAGTNAITFTAGSPGPLTLSVVETDPAYGSASLPGTVNVDVLPPGHAILFSIVTPCRLLDTRKADGPLAGPNLVPGQTRMFTPSLSRCGVPATARAILVNVTVDRPGATGNLVVWGDGIPEPPTPLMILRPGRARALMAAIMLPNVGFWIHNDSADQTPVIVDVTGYFE